ncbi:MAG: response regulator [Myxococcota bacterium]|nr:response regulator [Myxococcota bacterium]
MNVHAVKKKAPEPSFPIRWLTVIMVFELALIGISVWLIGFTEVRVREGMKRQVRLERLHGDIVHLDEVLTMSARMGAASGDPKWEKRYLSFEPLLDDKIREVMAEAEVLELDLNDLGISTTNDANSRLVALEKASFDYVRKQDPEKARALLASEDYKRNKGLYAAGLKKLLSRLDTLVGSLVASQKRQIQLVQMMSFFGWGLLIVVWIGLFRGIRNWRKMLLNTQTELATYQTHLEHRVISMTKKLTKAEHRERQRIAGLLHDQLQQLLVASRLRLSLLPESDDRVQVNDLLEQSINLSRSLTYQLNPPSLMAGGFDDALRWLADWVSTNHGLEVAVTVNGDLPTIDSETKVIAYDGIREILFNIVKHAETTSAAILATESEHGGVVVEIVDEGIGFEPEVIWSGECFGLLNTIRRLEMVGGSVEIDAQLGLGCRAVISFPSHDLQLDNRDTIPRTGQQKTRVLVVDDHPVLRAGLVSTLERLPDVDVFEAGSFSEVQSVVDIFEPTVAIVDISLGADQPDGYEVASYLSTRVKPVKVIAFTSFDDHEHRERMAEAGAVAYFVKGCEPSSLFSAIRT